MTRQRSEGQLPLSRTARGAGRVITTAREFLEKGPETPRGKSEGQPTGPTSKSSAASPVDEDSAAAAGGGHTVTCLTAP